VDKVRAFALVGAVLLLVLVANRSTTVIVEPKELPVGSLYDVELDLADDAVAVAVSMLRTGRHKAGDWTVEVAEGAYIRLNTSGASIVSGVTVAGKAAGVPVRLTVTALEAEKDSVVIRFKTGLLRVRLK
jgi:hypothetical protein